MTTATAGAGTNETTQFTTGAQVSCKSGPCGKLTRVIIDPVKRTLTHLVVEPRHGETGRLVPLKLVGHSSPDQIDLACTQQEFDALDASQETDYFPMDNPYGSLLRGLRPRLRVRVRRRSLLALLRLRRIRLRIRAGTSAS